MVGFGGPRIVETAAPHRTAATVQRKMELPLITSRPLCWWLQLALEPAGHGLVLHGVRLVAILAAEPSRSPSKRRQAKCQLRVTPRTPAIFDLCLLHADILAHRPGVSILNLAVAGEYSTLGYMGLAGIASHFTSALRRKADVGLAPTEVCF